MMTRNDFTGVLLSAGAGLRLGRGNKGLVQIAGRSCLDWTLDAMLKITPHVVVTIPEGDSLSEWQALAPDVDFVYGGATRMASIECGLKACRTPWAVINDVARPFVDATLIDQTCEAAQRYGAATVATPVLTPVARLDGNMITDVIARRELVTTLMPMAGHVTQLLSALAKGGTATDEALNSRLAALGLPVACVPCGYENIKITTETDVVVAEELAKRWLPQ